MTDKSPQPSQILKRGRKPLGSAPMSDAERKRRSRARQTADGTRAEFMISLSGETLAFVDSIVQHNQVSRSTVVQELLELAITLVHGTAVLGDKMLTEGATLDEVQSLMRKTFQAPRAKTEVLLEYAVPLKK